MTRTWPCNTASLVGACISVAAIFSLGSYFIDQSLEAALASPPSVRRRLGLILDPKTVEKRDAGQPPTKSTEVVVARYYEDLSWLNVLDWAKMDVTVYNKGQAVDVLGDGVEVTQLVNVPRGRETHTYLYHILRRYDDLPEWTVFTQGSPQTHSPIIETLLNDSVHFDSETGFQCLTCGYLKDYIGLPYHCDDTGGRPVDYEINAATYQVVGDFPFDWGVDNFMNKNSRDFGVPPSELAENLLSSTGVMPREDVPAVLPFCFAAIFAVHRDNIQQHPRQVYESLMRSLFSPTQLQMLAEGGSDSYTKWNCPWTPAIDGREAHCEALPKAGYLFERLWPTIFKKQRG